jgi:Flp pilus assembly protein TadB
MEIVVSLVHAGVGAVWLGSMAYSLFVAQPRIARVLAAGPAEDVYRELAAGNRWRVVALIATLALSGLGLAAVVDAPAHARLWWVLVAAKTLLLVLAAGAFWWVSWRGWPGRVFALPAELPAVQRRFRQVALLMCGLVGSAFALGVIVTHL